MLRMGASAQKVTGRKGKQRRRITYLYESNFAGSVDNWFELSGVLSLDHSQSVGGESNALKITAEAATGKASSTLIKNIASLSSGDIVAGNDYEISFKYYIDSANDEIFYVERVTLGGRATNIDTGAVSTDTWLSRSVTFTAGTTADDIIIIMNEDHESGTVDLVYFKDIKVRQV